MLLPAVVALLGEEQGGIYSILSPADAQGDEAVFERRLLNCYRLVYFLRLIKLEQRTIDVSLRHFSEDLELVFCGRLSLSKEPLTFPDTSTEDLELVTALRSQR